mgnify:CR=1 FL=1
MAIDHRIIQQIGVRNNAPVLNMFQNALNQQQARDIRGQQAQQQAELQPFKQQLLEQQVAQGQQQANQARQQQILKSVNDFALGNQSLIQGAQATGDFTQLRGALEQRKAQLQQQGLPTETTDEGITLIDAGQGNQVISALGDSVNLFNQQQGRQVRVTSSRILDDGTTVQSLSTGGTNVISPSGQALEGNARTDALNKALQVKVEQKGKGAQVVSDVKVGEVKRLEEESKQKAQEIEKQKINIDETKFKNAERRDQVINAKNARRKEADSAIIQIDSLLKDDRFSQAFGKQTAITPELLRKESVIDAVADVDQIKGLITLESRQKLKGQGTITDSEQKILAQSATVLDNPLISDDRARRELRKIKRVFEDASDRNQLKRETKDRIEAEASEEVAPTSQFQEGQTATGPNGEKIVFKSGQWVGL